MRLGKLSALTGVIIFSIAVIFGCSSDKTTYTPTITYGSVDDPEFVPVKDQIDNTVNTLVEDILAGFNNLYVAPGDTSSVQNQLTPPATVPDPDAEPDVLITIYENGWHFVYATYTGDIYYAQSTDSIMFKIGDTPVQHPTIDVDYIHYIDNWNFTALDQEVSHIDFTGRNEFELSDLDQKVAVIDGSTINVVETNYFAVDTTLTNWYNFQVDVNNVNVPRVTGQWITGCPLSGSLDITLSNVWNWSNGSTFGSGGANWTVNVVFNEGNVTVTAGNGDETWRYECEICVFPSE